MQHSNVTILPLLPMRGYVLLPGVCFRCNVGREKSLRLLESLRESDSQTIITATQKDAQTQDPQFEDLYDMGVIATIKLQKRVKSGEIELTIIGKERVQLNKCISNEPFLQVEATTLLHWQPTSDFLSISELDARLRKIVRESWYEVGFPEIGKFLPAQIHSSEELVYTIVSTLLFPIEQTQALLQIKSLEGQMKWLVRTLEHRLQGAF